MSCISNYSQLRFLRTHGKIVIERHPIPSDKITRFTLFNVVLFKVLQMISNIKVPNRTRFLKKRKKCLFLL